MIIWFQRKIAATIHLLANLSISFGKALFMDTKPKPAYSMDIVFSVIILAECIDSRSFKQHIPYSDGESITTCTSHIPACKVLDLWKCLKHSDYSGSWLSVFNMKQHWSTSYGARTFHCPSQSESSSTVIHEDFICCHILVDSGIFSRNSGWLLTQGAPLIGSMVQL